MVPIILLTVTAGLVLKFGSHASSSVPGESYLVCDNPATYLTSPWTYHALASGSQDYTVSQYQALSGYGTALPPLPAYISAQGASAPAATIYAPGSTVSRPAYSQFETPTIQFFEGGAYGELAMDTVSGEEFIGGSAPGFTEPTFDSAKGAGGINGQNGSYYYSGGTSTLASNAASGATTVTTSGPISGYIQYFTFSDGKTYHITNVTGNTFTLGSALTSAESSGQQVWANSTSPISKLNSDTAAGTTSIAISASTIPILKWQAVRISDHAYTISNVTGTQSGGYTITINGLDTAAVANTPVYFSDQAGAVTVSYLDINHDEHNTTGTIYTGAGWTITHNNIHDGNSAPGLGVAIYGGDQGDIEYNCLSKMGDYGVNIFGTNSVFDHNEIYESNYQPDPGCGCSGGGKWWGTLNADIVANAFVNTSPGGGAPIWFDNGNSGSLVQDNYFDKNIGTSVESETGFNLNITNNKFVDSGWGSGSGACGDNCNGQVNLNSSGGFHVPGSRYDNQIIVSGNQFINDWEAVSIWDSGARNCSSSGEAYGSGTDAPYCTGGFPNTADTSAGGQYYFSHIADNNHGGASYSLAQNAAAGATQVLVSGSVATNDQIGFADPAQTTTTSTTAVASLTGSQTINAASTAAFPSSGQLRVGATGAMTSVNDSSWTGAILSYTGKTATSFSGVSLVRGTGSLTGAVEQVQPYKATAETCYANDCLVTISPALASSVSAGNDVMNSGTCQLYSTNALTPTNASSPGGDSYWDGCQWRNRNISVTGNNFSLDRTAINAGTPLMGGTVNCSDATGCGINFQAFQAAGELPFGNNTDANAMMSNSGFTTCPSWDPGCTTSPLKNLNASANPPSGAPANNNEPAENITWSSNTYAGPWQWHAYIYGNCFGGGNSFPTDSATGHSMPTSPAPCNVDFAHWQSDWQQDAGSTWTATPTPTPSGTPTPTPTATPTATPTPTPSVKVGDLNHDGSVNIFDLSILLSHWGTADATSDINADGTVNIFDLSIFLSHWGT